MLSQTYKKRTKCGEKLPIIDFPKNKNTKDGFGVWCKVCSNKSSREWYYERGGQVRTKEHYVENRELYLTRGKKRAQEIRLSALRKISNPAKCNRCGLDDLRCLDIDHLKNDGSQERRAKSSHKLCTEILKMDEKEIGEKYQVLCKNCNWIRYLETLKEK